MITQLTLHNYRSLGKQVPLNLGPLTVLVGTPDSGKNHVWDALGFMSEGLREGLDTALSRRGGIDSIIRGDEAEPLDVSLSAFVRNERGSGYWEFRLSRDEEGSAFVKVETALWQPADQPRIHTFKVSSGQWTNRLKSLEPMLDRKAFTLPLVAEDPRFQELVHELGHIVMHPVTPEQGAPGASEASQASTVQALDPTGWSPALLSALARIVGDVSDVRGSAILATLLQNTPPTLVGIESPERIVAPGAVPALYDFLRQASRRTQVLLTTHRPEALELLDAQEVRVIEQFDGVTAITPFTDNQREDIQRSLARAAQSV